MYKDGAELKKQCFLDDGNQHSLRFAEDTEGQLYLLDLPYNANVLRLYEVNNFEMSAPALIPIDAEGNPGLQYAGMSITAPRTGSAPADFVDVIYPNADRTNWIYFRVQLR